MLQKLSVENYILIDRLNLEPGNGLNTITGETGAGKSILLGALTLLLGGRNEGNVIKDESRNCVVEGTFDISRLDLEEFFEENDLEYDHCIVIRRIISPAGKSRTYVNDLPVQLSTLKELGFMLVDIHSQHQSLMLGSDAFRINILDSVASHSQIKERYRDVYESLSFQKTTLASLIESAKKTEQDREYMQFQYDQLHQAHPVAGEQQELEESLKELSHAQQIGDALTVSAQALTEDERGILPKLKDITQNISRISEFYTRGGELSERIRSVFIELRDVEQELTSEAQRVESDPARLTRIEQRLDLLYSLQQKHKVESVEDLISLHDNYARQLESIIYLSDEISKLQSKVAEMTNQAMKIAAELHKGRAKASAKVKAHVEQVLAMLGMPNAVLEVEVSAGLELRANGVDTTRFLFAANRATAPQPVEKTASGGEMSRLMLGLKSIAASSGKLPTIIFDEIDSGVSGRIADSMGEIIVSMADGMQVINITHLPQVAAKGHDHFLVYKEDSKQGVITNIRRLLHHERIAEIAKMLSGSSVTPAAITQAELLLSHSQKHQ